MNLPPLVGTLADLPENVKSCIEAYGKAAQSMAVAAAVPDGWKLVPIEPTQEMCVVDFDCDDSVGIDSARIIYKAMLTASPEVKP